MSECVCVCVCVCVRVMDSGVRGWEGKGERVSGVHGIGKGEGEYGRDVQVEVY